MSIEKEIKPVEEIKHVLIQRGEKYFIIEHKPEIEEKEEVKKTMISPNKEEAYLKDGWTKADTSRGGSITMERILKTKVEVTKTIETEVEISKVPRAKR